MKTILVVLLLKSGKPNSCKLRDEGWCNFKEHKCVFSDVSRKNTDQSTPLETLLNENVRKKDTNNNCPREKPGDPRFEIYIEPCYSNGTATPPNLKSCPDIPYQYYTETVAPILNEDGKITPVPGAVTGIPVEFNVLHIGKNLVLGNLDNTKHKQANVNVQGTLLSKFKWRTIPVNGDTYKNIMEESKTNSDKNLRNWKTNATNQNEFAYNDQQNINTGSLKLTFEGLFSKCSGGPFTSTYSENQIENVANNFASLPGMASSPIRAFCSGYTPTPKDSNDFSYLNGCNWKSENSKDLQYLNILEEPASILTLLQSITVERNNFPENVYYYIGRGGAGPTQLPPMKIRQLPYDDSEMEDTDTPLDNLEDVFSGILQGNLLTLFSRTDVGTQKFWNSVPNFAKLLTYGVPMKNAQFKCSDYGYDNTDVQSASFAYWFAYMFRNVYEDLNRKADEDWSVQNPWPPKFEKFNPDLNPNLKQWESNFQMSFEKTVSFLFSSDYNKTFYAYESLVAQAFISQTGQNPFQFNDQAANSEILIDASECLGENADFGSQNFFWGMLKCNCFPMIITPGQCIKKGMPPVGNLERLLVDTSAPIPLQDDIIPAPDATIITLPQLTCPLEVRFADDRTPSMSATQQLENVYVESSNLFTDQPQDYLPIGRGCYMCFADHYDNLTKTLSDPSLTWVDHYHKDRCKGGYIVPSLDVETPKDYEKAQEDKTDSGPQDIFSVFRLGNPDEMVTTNTPMGVYKLIPFLDVAPVPAAFASGDNDKDPFTDEANDVFTKWEEKAAEQVGYYLDPNWHVTIEVVGMEKQKGKQIVRNFHGRIIEESLAIFKGSRFTYNDVSPDKSIPFNQAGSKIEWSYWLSPENNPFYPNNCLFNRINMDVLQKDGCLGEDKKSNDKKGCEEIVCQTDFPGDIVINELKGNLTVNMNIDLNEIALLFKYFGTKDLYYPKARSFTSYPGIYSMFLLPAEYDGMNFSAPGGGVFSAVPDGTVKDTEAVHKAPLARRKDGKCIDKAGSSKIQMPFAAQCLLSFLTDVKLESTTVSLCDPDAAKARYLSENDNVRKPIEEWIKEKFNPSAPTGTARELYNVFDSEAFKVAAKIISDFIPMIGDLDNVGFCLSPFGPTSTPEVFEFLALGCRACTPSNDADNVFSNTFGECMGPSAPCRGFMGPAPVGSDLRDDFDWSMFETVSEPIPCMFEQNIHFFRRFNEELCDPEQQAGYTFGYCMKGAEPENGWSTDTKDTLTFSMCDANFIEQMETFKFYDIIDTDERNVTEDNLGGIVLSGFEYTSSVESIVEEINILGVSVTTPLFSKVTKSQFPNGVIIKSTHELIHTRIQRVLGSGLVTSRGCNVILLGSPDVIFEQVEFDNAACQEQGLNQLTYLPTGSPLLPKDRDTIKQGFFDLKAWNMACIHITNTNKDFKPTDVVFRDIKLTSALNFRKMYPGRPLISIDNNGDGGGAFVNVEGMVLDGINDTHKYRDDRDSISDPVPLMPLQVIMWHVAGNVTLGSFPEETDMVIFSDRGSFNLLVDEPVTTTTYPCPGISSPPNGSFLSLSQYNFDCTAIPRCFISISPSISAEEDWNKIKKHVFCLQNSSFEGLNNLVVLDGSDFFDIAYDRYRCFDKPKLNCASEPVLPFFYVTFTIVGLYMIFFTFIRSTGLFQPDECLEILQTVDDALAEATRSGKDPLDEGTAFKEDVKFLESKEEKAEEKGEAILKRVIRGDRL